MAKIDFRLVEVGAELEALSDYRETLEGQLDFLRQQRAVQTSAQLKEEGWDPDDPEVDLAYQELRFQTEHIYPKDFRGGFLIALWAAYESGLSEVADFIAKRSGIELEMHEIRGNVLSRAKKYFNGVLGFELHPGFQQWDRLELLYALRNSYAHANGSFRAMTPGVRKTVQKAMQTEEDLEQSLGYVLVSAGFIERAHQMIRELLRSLVIRAKEWDDKRADGHGR